MSQKSSSAPYFIYRYGLIVILLIFSGLVLLYSFWVPFFEKPDELKHFAMIQFIQNEQTLPLVNEAVYQPWDQEGTQPPLYHILAALMTTWLDLSDFEEPARNPHYVDERSFVWYQRGNNNLYLHGVDEAWRWEPIFVAAHLSRLLSLLAGLGTVSLTYLLARIIFVDSFAQSRIRESKNQRFTIWHWLPLLSAGMVAFIPQFIHVSSAITNDSLGTTLAAAALVLLALMIKNGGSTRSAVYLGLVVGLGIITKLSMLYLLPLVGLVLLLNLYRHRTWQSFFAQSLIIGGVVLALAGWWYWRNWQIYGDPTALSAHLLYRGGALNPTPTLSQIWQTEMTGLELSFWAAFGAGQILLEPWIYEILQWVKIIVFVGAVMGIWFGVKYHRVEPDKHNPPYVVYLSPLITLVLLLLWCFIIFGALLRWMQITPASWGRLLYPALPAWGVLAAWGLAQYGLLITLRHSPFAIRVGRTLSLLLPLTLVVGLLVLAIIAPFRYIRATYAKTPLITKNEIPADIERVDLIYDDALHLIGYQVESWPVHPGEWLPVTLYWQAVKPIEKNYSVFVHLLTNGGKIGESNTYPDRGNWPTSLLEPGKVLADTHYVFVSPEAKTPAVMRLALGIFEFEDPERAAKNAVNPSGEVVEPIVAAIPLVPYRWPSVNPSQPFAANFAGQIRLAGFDGPEQTIKPGDTVPITFYWKTLIAPGQNLNLFIHLTNSAGQQAAGFDAPPKFATNFWQPGNTIIDARQLVIPADLPPGNYQLIIGWYNLNDFARLPLDGGGDALTLLTISVEQ
jgi:hypothetical protein